MSKFKIPLLYPKQFTNPSNVFVHYDEVKSETFEMTPSAREISIYEPWTAPQL